MGPILAVVFLSDLIFAVQKVIVQVTQNLTSVLNTVNFELPTIFIPTGNEEHRYIPNSIMSVCKELEDTINQSVQNAIVALGADSERILNKIDRSVFSPLFSTEARRQLIAPLALFAASRSRIPRSGL